MLETVSSTNGAGEKGQLNVKKKKRKKKKVRSFFNSIYKNQLKMDLRPKCEIAYYKTPRGKHRQSTL